MNEMSRFTFDELRPPPAWLCGSMSLISGWPPRWPPEYHLGDVGLLAHVQHRPDLFVLGLAVPAHDHVQVRIIHAQTNQGLQHLWSSFIRLLIQIN